MIIAIIAVGCLLLLWGLFVIFAILRPLPPRQKTDDDIDIEAL